MEKWDKGCKTFRITKKIKPMNLPDYIKDAIERNETSLGDNPAFPPGITGGKFLDVMLSKRFEEVSSGFDGMDLDKIERELRDTMNHCKSVERTCKNALEKLCGDLVSDLFQIPEDTVTIDIRLSEEKPSQKMRCEPDNGDFQFDSIEDIGNVSSEIYKRRMTNALVEGASEFYAYNVSNYVQELFKIQPELPSLYSKIIKYSEFLTYASDELDAKDDNGGYVIVKVGQEGDKPSVEARGSIFPILLQQAVKGILEIAALHGLPSDSAKARYIMSRADFAMADKWDSMLGYPLWEAVEDAIEKSGNSADEIGYNFAIMELAGAQTDAFNETLQEVFANTGKGVKIIGAMCDYISERREEDDFDDYLEKNNSKYPIEDGYFTAEELVRDCHTAL